MHFFKNILTKAELRHLATSIGEAELTSSGQIRIVVRHHRHWDERRLSLHDLALKEFHHLGMEKTRNRTGVLILILLSERRFQIIADEGIHKKVEDGTWDGLAHNLSAHFQRGNFQQGLQEAILEVGRVLTRHFPVTPGETTDELPNEIIEQ